MSYRLSGLFASNVNIGYFSSKKCCTCKQELFLSEFFRNRPGADGVNNMCKNCANKYTKLWSEKNKEHIKNYTRTKYLINIKNPKFKEKKRKASKIWAINNKEHIKKYDKDYRIKNKEKINQWRNAYILENKDKMNKNQKIYSQKFQRSDKGIAIKITKDTPCLKPNEIPIELIKAKRLSLQIKQTIKQFRKEMTT